MSKFKDGDKVRVTSGRFSGVEGTVIQVFDLRTPSVTIKVTKATKGYTLGSTDLFDAEELELVGPDVREVGKKIRPELIKIGDKIRAVRVYDSGIEECRIGVVDRISESPSKAVDLDFWTEQGAYIGWVSGLPDFHYVLEEASTAHELTLAPVGTKFKAIRGPGSYHYLIYTKYREGWWICEAYNKNSDEFEVITVRSEKTTINEFDKGRSTYL